MNTHIEKINYKKPEIEKIRLAAELIKTGELVAFPTETVYGLGANAMDENAVKKIFIAKGRPQDNPLIVHISNIKQITELVRTVPLEAKKLIRKFWPGPLTIILKKSKIVPNIVTAGLNSVAIRMPKNKIALKIIKESGCPIAAPSANSSGKPSPTSAKHVYEDLVTKIPLIIDGGETEIGIESTVIDLTTKIPRILRPGKITEEEIQKIIKITKKSYRCKKTKSPGTKYKHYSPEAKIIVVNKKINLKKIKEQYEKDGKVKIILEKESTKNTAKNLFKEFRKADKEKVKTIIIRGLKKEGLGTAIMNRLEKASTRIIN